MKKFLFLTALVSMFMLVSCGNESKKENEEMQAHEDSIKKDTSINSSVNAANDFLNDTSAVQDTVKK